MSFFQKRPFEMHFIFRQYYLTFQLLVIRLRLKYCLIKNIYEFIAFSFVEHFVCRLLFAVRFICCLLFTVRLICCWHLVLIVSTFCYLHTYVFYVLVAYPGTHFISFVLSIWFLGRWVRGRAFWSLPLLLWLSLFLYIRHNIKFWVVPTFLGINLHIKEQAYLCPQQDRISILFHTCNKYFNFFIFGQHFLWNVQHIGCLPRNSFHFVCAFYLVLG